MALSVKRFPVRQKRVKQWQRNVRRAFDSFACELLVITQADTHAPEPPYCTYGLRVPASCVLHVPKAQGSLLPGLHALYVRRTRTSLGRAVAPQVIALVVLYALIIFTDLAYTAAR